MTDRGAGPPALTARIDALIQGARGGGALARLTQAERLARDIHDQGREAEALIWQARLHYRDGNLTFARLAAERAVEVLRGGQHQERQVEALTALGSLRHSEGDFGGALEALFSALPLARELPSREREMTCHDRLADVLSELGEAPRALRHRRSARRLAGGWAGPRVTARLEAQLAADCAAAGERDEAARWANQALAAGARPSLEVALLITLGGLDPGPEGEARLRRAVQLAEARGRLSDDVRARLALARRLIQAGPSPEAAELATQAADNARRAHDRAGELQAALGLALARRAGGDPAGARLTLEAGLDRASHQPRLAPLRRDVLRALAEVCEQLGDTGAALAHTRAEHQLGRQVSGVADAQRTQVALSGHVLQENARMRAALAQAAQVNAALQRKAERDPLTDLYNRGVFTERLEAAYAGCARHHRRLGLCMADIDHFKRVNDTYGHAVGDAVLRQVAALLASGLRAGDTLARWGGEEFALLMPGTDLEGARRLCERLRAAVAAFDWAGVAPGLSVTMSFGVVAGPFGSHFEELAVAADDQLYRAKAAGRNQVALLDQATP